MPAFEQENGYKIPAGWLIQQVGWRGKQVNNHIGSYKDQALVLYNLG